MFKSVKFSDIKKWAVISGTFSIFFGFAMGLLTQKVEEDKMMSLWKLQAKEALVLEGNQLDAKLKDHEKWMGSLGLDWDKKNKNINEEVKAILNGRSNDPYMQWGVVDLNGEWLSDKVQLKGIENLSLGSWFDLAKKNGVAVRVLSEDSEIMLGVAMLLREVDGRPQAFLVSFLKPKSLGWMKKDRNLVSWVNEKEGVKSQVLSSIGLALARNVNESDISSVFFPCVVGILSGFLLFVIMILSQLGLKFIKAKSWGKAESFYTGLEAENDEGYKMFSSLITAAESGALMCVNSGEIVFKNTLFERWSNSAKSISELSYGLDRERLIDAFIEGVENKTKIRWQGFLGSEGRKVKVSMVLVPFEINGIIKFVGSVRDCGEISRVEMRLSFERDKAEKMMEAINEAMLYLDAYGHVERASAGMLELLGESSHQLKGLWVGHVLKLVDRFEALEAPMEEILSQNKIDSDRWLVEKGTGELVPMELKWRKLKEESMEGVLSLKDISDRIKEMEKMKWEAGHDALTGLMNRRSFMIAIEESQLRMVKDKVSCYLVAMDLDGFKAVNDEFGHDAGDCILKMVSEYLLEITAPFVHVARLGGDEFAVILMGVNKEEVEIKSKEIEQAISSLTLKMNNKVAHVGVTTGYALLEAEDSKGKLSMKRADTLMYEIKKNRKLAKKLNSQWPKLG